MKRFLFPLLILPILAFAEGGLPDKPYIYVEGKAEIQKPADMVTIRFDVVARAPDLAKANAEVQSKAVKIFDLLNAKKIADTDVIAESLTSEPQFEHQENYGAHGKVIGYAVTRPFEIRVRDVAAFPKLVDQLIAFGGIEFSGVDGGLTKEREVQEQLWEKALTDARAKAERTVKPVGMKIDSVFAISSVAFLAIRGKIFTEEGVPYESRYNKPMAEETGPPQYKVAPVTFSQNVHVIYLISPAK
jgi:hypothetical protein